MNELDLLLNETIGETSRFWAKIWKNEEAYTLYKPTDFYKFAAKIWKLQLKFY